jgi:hypothetical protein
MTYMDLQCELKSHQLNANGRDQVLRERLLEHWLLQVAKATREEETPKAASSSTKLVGLYICNGSANPSTDIEIYGA